MRLFLASVAFAGLVSHVTAQAPVVPPPKAPPTQPALRDYEREVVLEGCLYGNRLKIAPNATTAVIGTALKTGEFVLEGPKETLRLLKSAHEGHQDEITGIAVIPASRTDGPEVVTKEVGKRTRVTAGTRSESSDTLNPPTPPKPVRLKFVSLRHLSDKCSIPG